MDSLWLSGRGDNGRPIADNSRDFCRRLISLRERRQKLRAGLEKRALSIQYVKEREFSKFEPLAGSFISALGTGEHIVAQQLQTAGEQCAGACVLGKARFSGVCERR